MKRVRGMIILLGIALLSAFVGGFVTAQIWERQLERWHLIAAQGQIYVATEIYHGHGIEVADETLANVPTYLRQADPEEPGFPDLLIAARRLYQEADIGPPADIRALLATAPPAPECRLPAAGNLPMN